jgi:acetaldehyde dehydrogenase (acetylating)
VILSTGGAGIVKAAYSSGKPAFGVGPGNVPVLIDTSADLEEAVAKVVAGKSFDYGTVCSSEQAIVAEAPLRDRILSLLKANKAYIANDAQKQALGKLLIMPNWTVNPQCVGQSPATIAKMAGFEVPPDTSIICAELEGVGKQYPLSAEKLSPVLSLYFVKDYAAALDTCFALLKFGGMGHTAVIHSKNDQRTREYAMRMPAMRVLVNTAAPYGSIGITTNLFPAMTLGCGAVAGNITSDNVGPRNLINIKRLAYVVRQPQEAFEMPIDYNAAGPGGHPAKAGPPAGPGIIERSAVTAAVERYLASRGVGVAAPAASAPPSAAVAQPPKPVSAQVSNIVDRYLAARGVSGAAPAGAASSVVSNVVDRFLAARGVSVAAPAGAVSSVVSNVVDRYLASRGTAAGAPPAPAVVSRSVLPNISAQVVDRFLAARGVSASKTEFG